MKIFDISNIIWEVYFCPFIQWCQVWILLLYGCLFLLFLCLFLFLCSNSVPTRFLLGANRFCSDPTRFILYYVRNFHGSVRSFSLKQQLKNRNSTEQKKYIITDVLDKKDKEKIEKHSCSLFFSLFSCTLFNCMKKWTFYGLYLIEVDILIKGTLMQI